MKPRALVGAWLLSLTCACAQPARPETRNVPLAPAAVAAAPIRPDARPASPSELAIVKRLMRVTERLRGLSFRAPVEVTIEGKRAMRSYVERALTPEPLERAVRRYRALGAIDPALDVRAMLVAVMEDELIGYYDPLEKRFAVRADIARALDRDRDSPRSLAWRATVVHELVHALQDQHFGLGEAIGTPRTTDADDAFGALVEGDATLVMLGYTAELAGESLAGVVEQPDRILAALTRSPEQLTPALREAPALLREPLLFRYREGALFCARLYRAGGWARVDQAQRAPPQTTRAIRKPESYLADAPELALALPAFEPPWSELEQDVFGALELTVLLELDAATSARVIDDWRGDRYQVLRHEDQLASFWQLEFASRTTARQIVQAFMRLGDPARHVLQDDHRVWVGRGLGAAHFEAAAGRARQPRVGQVGGPLATSAGGN